jgi:drug/metabolite transporter (DMT)-like permease
MNFRDWLKFLGCALIWGTSFLFIKIAVEDVSPYVLVFFRVLFALVATLIMVWIYRSKIPRQPRYIWIFAFLGFFNVALPFVLISTAEKVIPSGMASIMNSTVPLFTLLVASIFLKEERATLLQSIGLVIGFSGIVVLMSDRLGEGFNAPVQGMMMILIAAFFYATCLIFARKFLKGTDPVIQSLGQMMWALVFISTATLTLDPSFKLPSKPLTWILLVVLGLVNSGLANLLYYSLLNSVGPTRTVLVSYAFPLIAVLLGVIILREPFGWRQIVGGLLIIGGVIWVNSARRTTRMVPARSR